jgi:translocation and assembly module TamB
MMSEPNPQHVEPLFQRTWLRRSLLGLGAVLALLAATVLALPPVVSSDWARARVEQGLASATGKPASLRLLSFGWSDGLRVEGLLVGRGGLDDEGFLCSLERLHVDIGFLQALRRDLRLNVRLSGLRLRHRVEPGPKEPEPPATPAKALPALLKDTLATLRQSLKPAPRSGDLHIAVDLSDIAVRLDLPAGNSTLDLRDAHLRLNAPGLVNGPVRLDAGLRALLNGKDLAPLKVEASLDGLIDKAGQLAPAQARLMARAEAPGLHLTALGSVSSGFKTDLRLDLRQAAALVKPFAGPSLPEVSGALALGLTLSQPDADHLALGLVAFADALSAQGGPLGAKAVGPLKLNLLQEADFDLAAGTLRLPGTLNLLNRSAVGWKGEATGLNEGRPTVSVSIHPLHLQLDELLGIARAWLPPGLGLGTATVDAESLGLLAVLPEKPGQKPQLEASLKGLSLKGGNITRVSGRERLSLAKALVRLDSARAVLPGSGPGQLDANAAVELDGLRMQGRTPLTVKRISLARLAARIDAFAQEPAALFGVIGAASLDLACEVTGVDVPGKAQAPALTQTLALRADLPAAKTAAARLEALDLSIPLLRVPQPGKRALEAPLSLHLAATDIRLGGPSPLTVDVSNAVLALDVGQALRCAATGSLSGSAVQSSGGLTLDVQKLLALAAPLLPRQAKGSGGVDLDWKLSASLPRQQAPAPKPEKLSQTLARLGFLKELEAVLKLSEVSLDWPLAAAKGQPAETLRLRGLSTPRPLRAATTGGLRESSLSGSLAFGPLSGLPSVGPLARPLRGLLTLDAAQQGLRSVQLSEVLHTDGLEVDQNLRLTLDRLDQVLDRDQDRLAAILEHVDGTVGFDLKTGLQAMPGTSGQGVSGKGRIEAGFDARLSGGRSLALSARLLSPGLDLRLGPDTAVSGLTSSLRLDKRYTLSPGLRCAAPAGEVLLPLSEQVFDLFPAGGGKGNGDDEHARVYLHEFQSGGGSLGFNQLRLKSGALPLAVQDVFLRLDTSGPLPALRSFRAGLLGGNIQGSAMVKGARGNYTMKADLAFTGIDPSRLFPNKAARDLGGQAETAGRVSLSVPLTPDPEAFLQRMGLRADITRVGPRTLERMLYALDPDEQNETIVQQRRLMGIGYPRFVSLGLAYGNLSLSGEVEVKGFRLELPRIDRLPVGNLPIRKQLTRALAPVQSLPTILDAISAGGICRDPAGPPGSLKVIGNTAQEGVAP